LEIITNHSNLVYIFISSLANEYKIHHRGGAPLKLLPSLIASLLIIISCNNPTETVDPADNSNLIKIQEPIEGKIFTYGDLIHFLVGPETEMENISSISWSSDLSGIISDQIEFTRSDLIPGEHSITAIIILNDNTEKTLTRHISIHPRNSNAEIEFIYPDVDSLWFYNTENKIIECRVKDSSGAIIPVAQYQWSSDKDGIISTHPTLNVSSLSINNHSILFTAIFADSSTINATSENILIIQDPYENSDLMNDRELQTEADPGVPYVRDEWVDWIKENNNPIRSLDSEDFSDISFLNGMIGNREIVLMGEVAHGIKEQNKIRIRLIKYLHEQMGFNVVAFESGFYECVKVNEKLNQLSVRDRLKGTLYRFWNTYEMLDFFEYVNSTYSSGNPLRIAGFDTSLTGDERDSRPDYLKQLIMPIDSAFAESIYEIDNTIVSRSYNYAGIGEYVNDNYFTLATAYGNVVNLVEQNENQLRSDLGDNGFLIARAICISAREYINTKYNAGHMQTPLGEANNRDYWMTENFKLLKETIYSGEKIIVWAHNCHIQKRNREMMATNGYPAYMVMMGNLIDYEYPGDSYSICSFGYRGQINYGTVTNIDIYRSESIEAILYNARKKHIFIDLSQQIESNGNSWIFNQTWQTYIHSSVGEYLIKYIPKDQYDGIIFVDELSPPIYLN